MSRKADGEAATAIETPPVRANRLLLGHAAVLERLQAAIAADRLPGALLLTGPAGIGKATLAFRLARRLLRGSPSGPDTGAEDEPHDRTFAWVAAGSHPDLISIERRFDERRARLLTEIVVDDVRRIGTFLATSAAGGGFRVAIIDAVDDMNRHAANALLKVLEEPGGRTVLILVAHRLGRVLPTIASRCRRESLAPLDPAVLARLVDAYLPRLDAADRPLLIGLAQGSIGRALHLARHDGAGAFRLVQRHFSRADRGGDAGALMALADLGGQASEAGFQVATDVLAWWLRLMASACVGSGHAELLQMGIDDPAAQQLGMVARGASLDHWLALWEKTQRLAEAGQSGNLDRKQVLTTLLLGLPAA